MTLSPLRSMAEKRVRHIGWRVRRTCWTFIEVLRPCTAGGWQRASETDSCRPPLGYAFHGLSKGHDVNVVV